MRRLLLLICLMALYSPAVGQADSVQALPVRKNGLWGLISPSGAVLVPPTYEYISKFDADGRAIFKKGGLYGVINSDLRILIPAQFDDLRMVGRFLTVAQKGRWGALDIDGSLLLPIQFDRMGVEGGLFFKVWDRRKAGLYSLGGEMLISPQYDELEALTSDAIMVWKDGLAGAVKPTGEPLLPHAYTNMEANIPAYLHVFNGSMAGLAREADGQMVVPIRFDSLVLQEETLPTTIRCITHSKKIGIYAASGEKLLDTLYNRLEIIDQDLLLASSTKGWMAYRLSRGEFLWKEGFQAWEELSEGLLRVQAMNGRSGVFSLATDELIIPCEYSSIKLRGDQFIEASVGSRTIVFTQEGRGFGSEAFDSYVALGRGYWGMKRGDRWGLMNAEGQVIAQPWAHELYELPREGAPISAFRLGNLYGLYNANGQVLEKASFEKEMIAIYPEEGRATLRQGSRLISLSFDRQGKLTDRFASNNAFSFQIRKDGSADNGRFDPTPADSLALRKSRGAWAGTGQMQPVTMNGRRVSVEPYEFVYSNMFYLGRADTAATVWKPLERRREAGGKGRGRAMRLPVDLDSAEIVRFMVLNIGRRRIFYGFAKADGTDVFQLPVKRGKQSIPTQIGYIGPFSEGRAMFNLGGSKPGTNRTHPKVLLSFARGAGFNSPNRCTGGKWGFLDTRGEVAIEAIYQAVGDFRHGVAPVKKQGKWGVVNQMGEVVIPIAYDSVWRVADGSVFMLANYQEQFGYIDTLGRERLPARFLNVGAYSQEYPIAVQDSAGWGFVYPGGRWAVKTQYLDARDFGEGLAAVKTDKGWGFINVQGQMVIEPQYRDAGVFSNGIARVKPRNKNYLFIDRQGNEVLPPKYSRAYDGSHDRFVVRHRKRKYGLIDKQGKWVIAPHFSEVKPLAGSGKYYLVRNGLKWGVCDGQTGRILVHCHYRDISSFSEGLAAVTKFNNNHHGYIDERGKSAIRNEYMEAEPFSEGLALVKHYENKLYSYIDKSNRIVIDSLQGGTQFREGKATIYRSRDFFGRLGEASIIDRQGHELFKTPYMPLSHFNQGRVPASFNGKTFFIDSLGYDIKVVGEPLGKEGYAHSVAWTGEMRRVGKRPYFYSLGLVDLAGLDVSSRYYNYAYPWQNGIAKVKTSAVMGLANAQGVYLAPVAFSNIEERGRGIFMLERSGNKGYLSKDGRWIWEVAEW